MPRPKTGQEKVQFYCEDDSLFLSSYYLSMHVGKNLPGARSSVPCKFPIVFDFFLANKQITKACSKSRRGGGGKGGGGQQFYVKRFILYSFWPESQRFTPFSAGNWNQTLPPEATFDCLKLLWLMLISKVFPSKEMYRFILSDSYEKRWDRDIPAAFFLSMPINVKK